MGRPGGIGRLMGVVMWGLPEGIMDGWQTVESSGWFRGGGLLGGDGG